MRPATSCCSRDDLEDRSRRPNKLPAEDADGPGGARVLQRDHGELDNIVRRRLRRIWCGECPTPSYPAHWPWPCANSSQAHSRVPRPRKREVAQTNQPSHARVVSLRTTCTSLKRRPRSRSTEAFKALRCHHVKAPAQGGEAGKRVLHDPVYSGPHGSESGESITA